MTYKEWLRRYACAACGRPMEHCHHVRLGTGGGTGMKPDDRYCVPLCTVCHSMVHNTGQKTFEKEKLGGRSLKALAQRLYMKYVMVTQR